MPILIWLLIFFGCAAIGSFCGYAAVAIIAILFTAPGVIFEKLFPYKHVSKLLMFLVDIIAWGIVFFTLNLYGMLTT